MLKKFYRMQGTGYSREILTFLTISAYVTPNSIPHAQCYYEYVPLSGWLQRVDCSYCCVFFILS